MERDAITKVKFSELDINNSFFESLIEDYHGFRDWFERKADEEAYVLIDQGEIKGFLYLKDESESDATIIPNFKEKRRLKIGTLKIERHGTVLGQRFISIALHKMVSEGFSETYVTFFDRQEALRELFIKFGFELWGNKENGELVYYKTLELKNDIYKDYPMISVNNNSKYMLAIFPEYHTHLFPGSRLSTESAHIVEDLSFTNTIEKIYLSSADSIEDARPGDLIVIYRTKEKGDLAPAEYKSVATSICTIVDIKDIHSFESKDEFLRYCGKGSIFTDEQLNSFWTRKQYKYVIKMLYNISLNKRITRHELIEEIGIERDIRWTFFPITDIQLNNILLKGEVDESFVID